MRSKFSAAGQNYINKVHSHQSGYRPAGSGGGDSSVVNVGGISIVPHPGMSPDAIANTVVARIEDARVKRVSYAEMSTRSSQVAAWLLASVSPSPSTR